MVLTLDDLFTSHASASNSSAALNLLLRIKPSFSDRIYHRVTRPKTIPDAQNLWNYLNIAYALGNDPLIALTGKDREFMMGGEKVFFPALYQVTTRKIVSQGSECRHDLIEQSSLFSRYSIEPAQVLATNYDLLPHETHLDKGTLNSLMMAVCLVSTLSHVPSGQYRIKADYRQMNQQGFDIELKTLQQISTTVPVHAGNGPA